MKKAASVLENQKRNGTFNVETVAVGKLKEHPRNYREHPEDQFQHIKQSLQENGFYKNIVVANDLTVLAGHGVLKAAKLMGYETVPVVRLPIDANDHKVIKVLIGDNQIAQLAMGNDRQLTEMLKELSKSNAANLIGTGFDAAMLSALAFVSRTRKELSSPNEAAEWTGMPEFNLDPKVISLSVCFDTNEERDLFIKQMKLTRIRKFSDKAWSCRWPDKGRKDSKSLRFVTGDKIKKSK